MGKSESVARVAISYVIGLGLGAAWLWWGPDTGHLWLDALLADVLATLVVFAASRMHRNSSFYDAYWSVLPPFLALYWFVERSAEATDARFWLLFAVLVLWAVRLTGNWVYSFPGLHHEDWRYGPMKERAGDVAGRAGRRPVRHPRHPDDPGVPRAWCRSTSSPVRAVGSAGSTWWRWSSASVPSRSRPSPTSRCTGSARTKEPGQVMDRGLWAWSRHPNYFGEFSFWLSLGLFGLAASPSSWWSLVGAVAMLAMFLGASIPMMEKRSLERRPAYQDVVDRVSLFVPRPPRRTAT